MIEMPWWAWILLGLLFLGLELLLGTFFLLFAGAAALIVGLFAFIGGGPAWLQWLMFIALSVSLVLLLRRPLIGKFKIKSDPRDIDNLVGQTAMALENIDPDEIGKVEMRGTAWNARNSGSEPIVRGQRCTVELVQGLQLWVSARKRGDLVP
jgi:membrane protein implicated in regulation of membrane protease activity